MSDKLRNQHRMNSAIFYALSDPIRLEIISDIRDGEKCVCEIVPHLSLIQPLVSRHLRILKNAGIVKCRKDGNKRMYSITNNRIYDVVDALTSELAESLLKEAQAQIACA